jgi:transcriptional regulator with XRE-family HTH domain
MAKTSNQIIEDGIIIKHTCRDLSITQKELADILNLSKTTISDWANNKTPIPKMALMAINLLKTEKECAEFKLMVANSLKFNGGSVQLNVTNS